MLLKLAVISIYFVVLLKEADSRPTLGPGDDYDFFVVFFNQSYHLVIAHSGALVSISPKIAVVNFHLLELQICLVKHDYVGENVAFRTPTKDSDLIVIYWGDCGIYSWG